MKKSFNLLITILVFFWLVPTSNAQKIYWADTFISKIWKANPDGSEAEEITPAEIGDPVDLQVDPEGEKIYFTDRGDNFFGDPPQIARMNLDGTGLEVLFSQFEEPGALELDVTNGKIYFTERSENKTYRANLDGTDLEEIPNPSSSFFYADYLLVDSEHSALYFCTSSKIWKTDLEGGNPQEFINLQGSISIAGFAIDEETGTFYWLEDSNLFGDVNAKIFKSDLNGENIELVRDLVGHTVVDLLYAKDEHRLYWCDKDEDALIRMDADGGAPETIFTNGVTYEGISINPLEMTSSSTDIFSTAPLKSINVYPNPTRDILHFDFHSNLEKYTATVSTLTGTPIFSFQTVNSYIDVSHLPEGLYIINYFDDNKKMVACSKFGISK